MTIYQPYTYVLTHLPTGKRYYGVRFAKGCNPSDLFTSYFTSSKKVKDLIKVYGVESFATEVRRTFTNAEAARRWETKVLRRLNVNKNSGWLNITWKECPTTLGMTYNEDSRRKIGAALIGKPKTEEHKQAISAAKKGTKLSEDFREKCRQRHLGRKDSPETIAKRAASNTGRKRSPETIARMREAALRRHQGRDKERSTISVS